MKVTLNQYPLEVNVEKSPTKGIKLDRLSVEAVLAVAQLSTQWPLPLPSSH